MRKLYILLFLFLFALPLQAQSWESVKDSDSYIYGEGWGSSIDEADKQALADLISKIAISVSTSTLSSDNVNINNGQLDETSQFSSSVNTYAQATLTNTQRIILQNEPDAHVGRWIKRSEIEKIFASRIAKLKDMVGMAEKAEAKGKADDALRNYYWALTLLKSLQRPNDVTYTDDNAQSHLLITWIPQKMNEIFDDLSTKIVNRDGDNVELFITYKDKPVNSVDYTYFDGRDWSNVYSAKDGRGVLELAPGNRNSTFQLKYEFEYRGQAQIDRELESVLNVVKSTPMRDAYVTLNSSAVSAAPSQTETAQTFSSTSSAVYSAPQTVDDCEAYKAIVDRITRAIRAKEYETVQSYFTTDGWDIYTRLIRYGSARIVGAPACKFYKYGDNVVARGVQMAFSFKRGVRKSFVEDVVFTFDADKKISNIAFGLGNTAADDILNKGVWGENARLAIMDFLENYKTAYALERRDYIESIFDDNAVIIIANVAQVATVTLDPETGATRILNNPIIKHNRYSKDVYLSRLERCFDSNEFINIRFANNDVLKMSQGGELYAIQIAQDYYSTSYGDKGYLFLMVDINDPDRPIIKVRTWQPEKDPNFGLYGPGDF